MVLIVFLRRRTSPFTSTVILRDRSPLATAVVTSAMFRTWSVRFAAIPFTLSVRAFHVPATPGTSACPPSLPSVPTCRATVVTCTANTRSVSIIELIVSASSATSPFASIVNFCARSPVATAVTTLAIPRTCVVRFVAMKLTLSVRSFHVPETPLTCAWPPRIPSVPTSRATRVTSSANDESWSTMVLIVFLSSSTSPLTSTVIFFVRSPFATAVVTRDARDLRGERAELIKHRVHGRADAEKLPAHLLALDLQGHLLRQVAFRDRIQYAGNLDGRTHQIVDHRVDRAD